MTYDTLDCYGYPEPPDWNLASIAMAGLLLAAFLVGLLSH